MISTYAELVSAVQSRLARTDIPADVYSLAVQELNTRLRLRLMETQTTLATVADTATVTLPTDFLQMRALWIEDGGGDIVLEASDAWNAVADDDGASGRPRSYALSGSLYLQPTPDTDYTLGIRYVSSMAELSEDSDTNDVLAAHSALFLYCALKHAAIWVQDAELAALYAGTLEGDLRNVRRADKAARFPGPLRARATVA